MRGRAPEAEVTWDNDGNVSFTSRSSLLILTLLRDKWLACGTKGRGTKPFNLCGLCLTKRSVMIHHLWAWFSNLTVGCESKHQKTYCL